MKVIKFIICFLLSFILVALIFATLGLHILKNKVLNKDYILSKMDELKFYDEVSNEIIDGIENYKYQSGLPEELLDNLFNSETVKEDVNSIINNIYDDSELSNHSEEVKALLDERIYNYVEEQKIKLSEEGKQNIRLYEDYIVLEYVNNVGVSNSLVNMFRNAVNSSNNIINKINNIHIIALVITVVLIIIINIKNLLMAINWCGISSLVSGMLFLISTHFINSIINFDEVVLFKKSASNLIINIVREQLYSVQDIGKLMIFCGVLSILVSNILNYINLNKKENKKEE